MASPAHNMLCLHCGTQNRSLDHRCYRCARRLDEIAPVFRGTTAALPAYQELGYESEVVFAGCASAVEEQHGSRHRGTTLVQYAGVEETLELEPVRFYAPGLVPQRSVSASLESVIECDARAAVLVHRVLAAALDASMVVVGVGVMLGVLAGFGVEFVLNRQTVPVYVLAGLLIKGLYEALWCIAGADTFGMRATGVRLLTLDGGVPSPRRRVCRLLARTVSLCSAGLGFLWSACDEETLCWHDHVSGTFPATRLQIR